MIGSFIVGTLIGAAVLVLAHAVSPSSPSCTPKRFFHTHNLLETILIASLSGFVFFGLSLDPAQLTGYGLVVLLRLAKLLPNLRNNQ